MPPYKITLSGSPSVRVAELRLYWLGVQTFAHLIHSFLFFIQREMNSPDQILAALLVNHMVLGHSELFVCLGHSRGPAKALKDLGASEMTESMHYGDLKPSWQFLTTSHECELGRARRLELREVGSSWSGWG